MSIDTDVLMLANSNTFISHPDNVELTVSLKGLLKLKWKLCFTLLFSLSDFQKLIKGFDNLWCSSEG